MRSHRFTTPLACFLIAVASAPPLASQISIQITVGPPPIPIYEQPVLPEAGFLWMPGFWAWGEEGYYWVPGTWVRAPERGLLWTPGYWAWNGDYFLFYEGYWGTRVGYYGGINYGYGYGGSGFEGGHWEGPNYYYNRSVTNVNVTRVTNIYNKTVIVNNTTVAYNGGPGGLRSAPTQEEQIVARERRVQPTREQVQHHQVARQNKELLASVNRGKPPVAATAKPADFSPRSVVEARAPGGRVEETTLKATPKTLPPPSKGPVREPKPNRPDPRPAPAPEPAPQRRPEPAPNPIPDRRPEPPPPQPHPGRRPEPAPNPAPGRRPEPAPQPKPDRRPEPGPNLRPDRRPEPAPQAHPERRPEPPLKKEKKPSSKPAPRQKPEPKPDPDPPRR